MLLLVQRCCYCCCRNLRLVNIVVGLGVGVGVGVDVGVGVGVKRTSAYKYAITYREALK